MKGQGRMDRQYKYRLRVESCIGAIMDVQRRIGREYENQELLAEFEELRRVVEGLDMRLVSELDVLMVEQATNALLWEFRPFFEDGDMGSLYGAIKN